MSTPESRAEGTPEPSAVAAPEPSDVAAPEPSAVAAPEPSDVATPAPSDVAAPETLPAVMPEPATDVVTDQAAADAMPDAASDPVIDTGPVARNDDLRAAVGLPERSERGGAQPRGPRRRIGLFIGATALLGVIVAGVVFLGRQNQQRYYLVCGEDDITAAQGRSFPPWGRSALEGKAWQAIPRPLEAPCADRVFDGREALARSFGETLVARVDAWVIARADGAGRERLAEAQAQLDQALRVLRELRAGLPELSGKIQRLRGDLDYWQARDRIDTAMAELARAAQHLDSAVAHDPHHNREHALAWRRVIARLQAELGAGPAGSAAPGAAGDPAQPDAAARTALPAWPGTPAQPGTDMPPVSLDGGPTPAPGSTSDAGPTPPPPVPDTAVPEAPQPPPDAGTPRGGLLI